MIRRLLALLLPLLVLAGCQDRELPTALAPEGPLFDHVGTSYVVSNTGDSGEGSLRYAIEHIEAGGTITFAEALSGRTITLTSGQLTIAKSLTISGPGAHLLTVERSSADAFRIFQITSGVTVSISGLTIAKGNADSNTAAVPGGGILNEGTLTLTHSTVFGNSADFGGGIYNAGTLTLTNSTVAGNSASSYGGGIYSETSSDFSTTSTTILNSTISGNTAGGSGGGVSNGKGLTRIVHSTLTSNRARIGGGVWSWNDRVTRTDVKGSLIWGNTLPDETTPNDVAAEETVTRYHSLGYNLIGAAGTSVDFTREFNQTGDQVNVTDAKLGPLALNAPGTTETHALLAGSPAIDTGTCADHTGATVSTDQRGVSRPQPSGGNCDIGAYELDPTLLVAATATALSANRASPQEYGTALTLTAAVTQSSDNDAVTSGTVSFYDGGASCTDLTGATQIGTAQSLDSSGQAQVTTSTLSLGTHTLLACYSGASGSFTASEASLAFEITRVTTTVTLSVTPGTQQYSDQVTLSATVTPTSVNGSQLAGTVQFQVNGSDVGSAIPVSATGNTAQYTYTVVLPAQASAYSAEAVFTSTNADFAGSSDTKTLSVTREDAALLYASTNPAALQVSSAGGSLNAGALSLALQVKEKEPDQALSPGTTGIGDIANAGLSVTLAPVGPGSSYALTCIAGSVSGTGYEAVRPFTCTNSGFSLPVNTYEVQVSVSGAYYMGSYTDAFTVYDPSLGFATGGGTFLLDGEKVNFGFTMKYTKSGSNLQGNLILVRHHADGTSSRLKSNALGSLALGEDSSVPMGWASFGGKATYTTWNGSEYVTVGNQSFQVYAEDRNNPGSGIDRIWLSGPGALNMPGTLSTAKSNTSEISGGNISVPHKSARK